MQQELFKLIRKQHFGISIYTEEIFERRCQEEIIRSDEDKSSFVYLEFDFNTIEKFLKSRETCIQFWEVFFAALNKNSRRSDVIGFLEKGTGLGMLLLDSKIEGWIRVRGRLLQTASDMNFSGMSELLASIMKPIVYPACVTDAQDINAISSIPKDLPNSSAKAVLSN